MVEVRSLLWEVGLSFKFNQFDSKLSLFTGEAISSRDWEAEGRHCVGHVRPSGA
jgi:hypothetical protein